MTGGDRRLVEERPATYQVTVAVDMIRCDGHGICAWLLPERISLDRWGYPVVDPEPLPASSERRARRAANACPRKAIAVSRVEVPAGR